MRQISDTMRTAYAYDFTVSYYYGCGYLAYTNSHERITLPDKQDRNQGQAHESLSFFGRGTVQS